MLQEKLGELREMLRDFHESNTLISMIFVEEVLPKFDDEFIHMCIQMHNRREIDLVSAKAWASFERAEIADFFSGQHFFCKALPELDASHSDMMRVTKALVDKAGNDLAANEPNAAFVNWCVKDIARARAVLENAKNGDELASAHLPFAFNSHNLISEAMEFVQNYQDGRRLSAIAALARMEYSERDLAAKVIRILGELLKLETDDRLRAHVLGATFDIVDKAQIAISTEIAETIKTICTLAGDETRFGGARCLAFNSSARDEVVLDHLLDALTFVSPEHKGILQNLDLALSKLLGAGFSEKAATFVQSLIVRSDGQIKLSEFRSFMQRLTSGNRVMLHRLLGTWLLGGQPNLCENLTQLFRQAEGYTLLSDLSFEELSLNSVQHIFVARKAIGYFFMYPKVMAAILVALLRECQVDAKDDISSLLFDPLMLNYGGAAKEYLESITKDDSVYLIVQSALKTASTYLSDLRSTGEIKELRPSASQRQVQRVQMREMSRDIQKQAEEHSVFLSLVHRSTVLYGRSSLSYFGLPGDLSPQTSSIFW